MSELVKEDESSVLLTHESLVLFFFFAIFYIKKIYHPLVSAKYLFGLDLAHIKSQTSVINNEMKH